MTRAESRKRYRHSDKGRAERARYRNTESGKAEKKRWKKSLTGKRMLHHTFVGVDGEGWTDTDGKHHYVTLTVGNKTLHKNGKPLSTLDCLAYLADRPVVPNQFYVSFFFDYDVTMILRDMAQSEPDLARSLFVPMRPGKLVWYKGFGIAYRPKKHFKVKRWTPDNSSPTVTIHDVQGFYQSSFVVALNKFDIGTPEQREAIASMKAQRANFDASMLHEMARYSESECELLAQLVAKLRDMTHLAKTNASPYEGPGDMARRALDKHYGKETHKASLSSVPGAVHDLATRAYYGGRFEILAHGPIGQPVYEYDIKSAYPDAMTKLPCLVHGTWRRGIHSDLFIAEVEWTSDSPSFGNAMPYPVRRKDGSIYYPTRGHGWHWFFEPYLPAGTSLAGSAWSYTSHCNCRPFSWILDLYNERLDMEHEKKGSGIALKLMLNTLYGKMAQQKPVRGTYFNMVYASLITAYTRKRVYDIYLNNPGCVMFATDAVFSTTPPSDIVLDNPIGESLGFWEIGNGGNPFTDMVIFQPGVYFDGLSAAFKTRGVPKSVFRDNAELLRANALAFDSSYPVALDTHLSMRLALARGTDEAISQMGNWLSVTKNMSANPSQKRDTRLALADGIYWSMPIDEYGDTVPYTREVSAIGHDMHRLDDDLISDGYYEGEF